MPFDCIVQEVEREPENKLRYAVSNPVQYIYASKLQPNILRECLQRDEAIWYDNVESIFSGEFKKSDLFFYKQDEYNCYADYSIFDNVNLRTLILLYETTFIALPIDKSIDEFLSSQKISRDELLDLVQKNRIKIVLRQPEFRQDITFLHEVYRIAPENLISRRAIAALMQADLVETANNYIFSDSKFLKELRVISDVMQKHLPSQIIFTYDLLTWPVFARRHSFEALNNGGIGVAATFGINNVLEPVISRALNKDLSFEFTVNAENIHLAHALNATYFPFKAKDGYSDNYYATVMGDFLNVFRNANAQNVSSLITARQQRDSGVLPIDLINAIEVNDYIPLADFESILSRDVVNPSSRRLIQHLSNLEVEERYNTIGRYNKEISEKLKKYNKSKIVVDLGTNGGLDTLGLLSGIPFIGTFFSLLKIGGKSISKVFPEIKNTLHRIEEIAVSPDKQNIHYLTRINRVARLKPQK